MATIKEIKAGEFSTRAELENHMRNKHGLTVEPKKVKIVGTEAELKRLQLSSNSTFWGIGCECVDAGPEAKPVGKVPRGKRTAFGIENRESPRKAPDA